MILVSVTLRWRLIVRQVLSDGYVRFGSIADICAATDHVRFTPESGHLYCTRLCPLRASSGHLCRQLCSTNGSSTPNHWLMTLYRCHSSGSPLRTCDPASMKPRPEPATRSFTVCETSTVPGDANAPTRAAICNAIPWSSPCRTLHSPVCSPIRQVMPTASKAFMIAIRGCAGSSCVGGDVHPPPPSRTPSHCNTALAGSALNDPFYDIRGW